MSNIVWRDVAIVIGVLAIRLSMANTKNVEPNINFALIYLAVALYMSISFLIAVSTDEKFLTITGDSQKCWRKKLYAFLDDTDYESLAGAPLAEAKKVYASARARTALVVGTVVLCLFVGFAVEMQWIDLHNIWQQIWNSGKEVLQWLTALLT